ncbi:ScbR family autoregulator-binding transcription factor [Kitasatospora cineracea]|uniref:ScbR family autoregulator-binding transcription factor n=1 Tax=Kitasatospora cineracea TaxID=88074 RepID=UPI00341FDB54
MVKQERALRTRETLVRSAAEMFHQEGFTVASLATISRRAGVSNGALHFHFANKAAVADAVEESALARLRAVASDGPKAADCCLQRLVDATYRLARELSGDVVLRAGFELGGDPARSPGVDLRGYWQHWVQETLRQAGERGELRPEVVPEEAATAVVAGTVGMEVLGTRQPEWLDPRTVGRFWRLLLPTLAPTGLLATLSADGVDTEAPQE